MRELTGLWCIAVTALLVACGDDDSSSSDTGRPDADVVETSDDTLEDTADTGDDTSDTGDDAADTGDDTVDTGDDTVDTDDDGDVVSNPIVTVLVPFGGDDLMALAADFATIAGIDVEFVDRSGDTEGILQELIAAGTPPDLAAIPQPGLVNGLASDGVLVPIDELIEDNEQLDADYAGYLRGLVSADGHLYGLPFDVNVKSLIWYPKAAFDAAGYTVPTTWDELIALSDRIVADGGTPWCLGIESGDATGWVGTDWIEDLVLADAGVDIYDQWVAHEIPFTHPSIRAAFERFGQIAFTEGYVAGGVPEGIVDVFFGDSPTGMFEDPPSCWLHRQASFIQGFFPDDTVVGTDVSVFRFPVVSESAGATILGGGGYFAAFSDRPEVAEVLNAMVAPEFGTHMAGRGIILSNLSFDLANYEEGIARELATVAHEALAADGFRFDASDLMPFEVGGFTFWEAIVDFVESGLESLDEVLDSLEDAWGEDLSATWYVAPGDVNGDGSEAAPFNAIPAALEAAADGDTIIVAAGTYEIGDQDPTMDGPFLLIDKSVTLLGSSEMTYGMVNDVAYPMGVSDDPSTLTVLRPPEGTVFEGWTDFIGVSADDVTIRGFRLVHDGLDGAGAIHPDSVSNFTLEESEIRGSAFGLFGTNLSASSVLKVHQKGAGCMCVGGELAIDQSHIENGQFGGIFIPGDGPVGLGIAPLGEGTSVGPGTEVLWLEEAGATDITITNSLVRNNYNFGVRFATAGRRDDYFASSAKSEEGVTTGALRNNQILDNGIVGEDTGNAYGISVDSGFSWTSGPCLEDVDCGDPVIRHFTAELDLELTDNVVTGNTSAPALISFIRIWDDLFGRNLGHKYLQGAAFRITHGGEIDGYTLDHPAVDPEYDNLDPAAYEDEDGALGNTLTVNDETIGNTP